MLYFLCSLLLSVVTSKKRDVKIYEGFEADIKDFPFIGSLQHSLRKTDRHRCTTNLITEFWSITAGSCIVMEMDCGLPFEMKKFDLLGMHIVMGKTDLSNDDTHGQTSFVTEGHIHPSFKLSAKLKPSSLMKKQFDLGTVKVKVAFQLIGNVGLMPMVTAESPEDYNKIRDLIAKQGDSCLIPGWGSTSRVEESSSAQLRFGMFELLSPKNCCSPTIPYEDDPQLFPIIAPQVDKCQKEIRSTGQECFISSNDVNKVAKGDEGSPIVCTVQTTTPKQETKVVIGINIGFQIEIPYLDEVPGERRTLIAYVHNTALAEYVQNVKAGKFDFIPSPPLSLGTIKYVAIELVLLPILTATFSLF